MAAVGKSLTFDNAEIDELLNLKYAGQRTFSVLSVLYPGLDLSKKFHEDHIFPTAFPSEDKRATYLAENDLDGLPLDLADFALFFEQRKQRIRTRLLAVLGAAPGSLSEAQDRD